MEIKWMYSLLALCLGFVTSEGLSITCRENCIVNDKVIEGRNGTEIKLYFTIKDDSGFLIIDLFYNNVKLLAAARYAVRKVTEYGMKNGTYRRFKASITAVGTNSVLQLTFRNLSMQEDNDKKLEYSMRVSDGSDKKGTRDLIVLGGPTLCGPSTERLKGSYDVHEDGSDRINLTLCGKPSPNITASIGNTLITDVKKVKKDKYEYTYSISSVDITRRECGFNMSIKAKGDSTLSLSTKVNVLFTPAKVNNIYPYLHGNSCMTVTWDKVEAGSCKVEYQLIHYNGTNSTVTDITLSKLQYEICNASRSDTVKIRGLVNKKYGEFSEPVRPSMSPPTIPTTIVPPIIDVKPTKGKVTDGEPKMAWKYILAIVVGTIALILITAVIVIAVRRKDKTGNNNNDSGQVEMLRPNQEVESDYADVNTLSTLIRPPINKSIDDQQMVYAELGPGGGRLGPKHIPEESNYAQVKTEGVHYPELQQTSYREHPHSFSVATRAKNDSSSRPPDKDDYDDYDEDIIV